MKDGYIPPNERRTILLLADDARLPSGVGTMSKEIIIHTAHRFNWVQVGGAVNHPEAGKRIDASQWVANDSGVEDAKLMIYPMNGYGTADTIRYMMMTYLPSAILHFTDPRYWVWLYHMEAEIRNNIPIVYYHVWDNVPHPRYNRDYYRSSDTILSISKQTHNIVKNVLGEENVVSINTGDTVNV